MLFFYSFLFTSGWFQMFLPKQVAGLASSVINYYCYFSPLKTRPTENLWNELIHLLFRVVVTDCKFHAVLRLTLGVSELGGSKEVKSVFLCPNAAYLSGPNNQERLLSSMHNSVYHCYLYTRVWPTNCLS